MFFEYSQLLQQFVKIKTIYWEIKFDWKYLYLINDSSNDAYDELLTQEEIQDHIDKINQLLALERIENCVKSHDVESLNYALNGKHLSLGVTIKTSLMAKYLKEIETKMKQTEFLRRVDVESIIVRCNNIKSEQSSANLGRDQAVKKVNMALESGNPGQLVKALKVMVFSRVRT